jgi:hypothetical protein
VLGVAAGVGGVADGLVEVGQVDQADQAAVALFEDAQQFV